MVVIISCANDTDLANNILVYLRAKLAPDNQGTEATSSKAAEIISLFEDEIEVSEKDDGINKLIVKSFLEEYLASDVQFNHYRITEFQDNIFVVAAVVDLGELIEVCEICGYVTPYYIDIYAHRLRDLFLFRYLAGAIGTLYLLISVLGSIFG